jgi:inner membrane protein
MTQTDPRPDADAVPPAPRSARMGWMRRSLTFRAIVVGVLVLLLLIPLSMVTDLVREREARKAEVEAEVSGTWGGAQVITGPVIDVPYDIPVNVPLGDGSGRFETRMETRYAHFLPERLEVSTQLRPERKHRSIYTVAVYEAHSTVSGSFAPLGAERLDPKAPLRWAEASVQLGISDLRSIKQQVTMKVGERTVPFEPGLRHGDLAASGLTAELPLDSAALGQPMSFSLELAVNGSTSFDLVPVGRETRVQCASSWSDPSFHGAFLPDTARIGADGFAADWTVLHLNRDYPQAFTGDRSGAVQASAFGVYLIQPVNDYQKNTRAGKYGVMLIVLVFLVFFFVEVLQKLRIHPIQYLLVGFALCVFYALLIAISEHLGFSLAYIIAAVATIGLVVFYAASVFRVRNATQLLGLIMLLVFGFMFSLIQEQDHALLFGSIGLFIVLALVMWVSRRIDWNPERD